MRIAALLAPAQQCRVVTPIAINDAKFVSSTIAETDHTAWNSGTAYTVGTRVRYVATDVHSVYECIQNHTNQNPTSTTGYWSFVSPTNRWCMFDSASGTVSTASSSIDVVIAPGRIDALALLDVDAHTARIRMTTAAEGTFYDVTTTLTGNGDDVGDWWDYFYAPINTRNTLVVTGLASISDAEVRVTIERSGGTVSLGHFIVGTSTIFGVVRIGARSGIVDYSRKDTDDFGRTTLTPRTFAKRMSLDVLLDSSRVDAVQKKLAALRATLALFVADSSSYESLQVYGWFKDFDMTINGPNYSGLTLEIEGLA